MKPIRINLTFAILASLACLLSLTWILLSIISFKTAEKDLLTQKNEEGRILLSSFVNLVPLPLIRLNDASPAGIFARRLVNERAITGLTVVNTGGGVMYRVTDKGEMDAALAEALRTGAASSLFSSDGRLLYRYSPLQDGPKIEGAARLTLSLAAERDRLARSRHLFLAYFIIDFLLLLGLGSFLLARIVVTPIRKLLAATERITAGDYSHMLHIPGCSEIVELSDSFNMMQMVLREKQEEVESHMHSLQKANVELQEAREETIRSEKMASVGLLAAGMAHEIGSPLSAIIGYAGILRDEMSHDPDRADYLRRIEQEAGRIDRIVRDLLNYARPSPPENERVDIAPFLGNVVDMLERQGVFKKVSLNLSIAEHLPMVCLDRHQLLQVLINLVLNARDAMPEGGVLELSAVADVMGTTPERSESASHFSVMGRRREDFGGVFRTPFPGGEDSAPCLRIVVSDSGEGISPESLEKIFDPFFTTKEPGKGTGLGLSISASIIDSFGGRITVESAQGQGSRFTIWLPACSAEEEP
ncbi:MAG: two-component sensor histidine kinase [Geobacter sp.]|nr:MAG: two-component sensor histidine kinase [Geobacter sp.]